MSIDLPRDNGWQALVLNTVVSTLLMWCWVVLTLSGDVATLDPVQRQIARLVLERPLTIGVAQTSLAVISVFVLFWGGRAFGGSGDFGSAISLVAWLAFVLNVLSVGQIAAWFVAPLIAFMVGLLAIVLVFVMLTSFCAELHGFESLAKTFVGIIVVGFSLMFGLSLLLAIIGVSTPGVPT